MMPLRMQIVTLLMTAVLVHVTAEGGAASGSSCPLGQPLEPPPILSDARKRAFIEPSVSVGILVRNKAHSLPFFLGHLERLDYPKQRMHLYIKIDNTFDNSQHIIEEWLRQVRHLYHSVDLELQDEEDAETEPNWTEQHYRQLIRLRQKALDRARSVWADFFLSLDADVILLNKATLRNLVETSVASETSGRPIVVLGPMLNCSSSEVFSNFWGEMTPAGYYRRSKNYFDIQRRKTQGVIPVAMLHSALLVNLRLTESQRLHYDPPPEGYNGPVDDIIIFARSVQAAGLNFYLDNREFFGYFPLPLDEHELLQLQVMSAENWTAQEVEYFVHLRIQSEIDDTTTSLIQPSPSLNSAAFLPVPEATKVGFDQIYLINLARRPDRLKKMMFALRELGVTAKLVEAVDGKKLTKESIREMNITQLSGYADPYHKRALKFGEIGCFLSHHGIWMDMMNNDYQRILILEDDLRFVPGFTRRLLATVKEADQAKPEWELLYVGRKRMSSDEKAVPGTRYLAYPSYTYWTLAYALTRSGASKLLAQRPLERLVAVDEFLPIMFNRHPNKGWLSAFGPRDLVAISAEPLLVEPTHYTGEPNYISDTEDSSVIPEDLCPS
ncbi:hypothetical protein SprV_0301213400 [Sparganum proliferum]